MQEKTLGGKNPNFSTSQQKGMCFFSILFKPTCGKWIWLVSLMEGEHVLFPALNPGEFMVPQFLIKTVVGSLGLCHHRGVIETEYVAQVEISFWLLHFTGLILLKLAPKFLWEPHREVRISHFHFIWITYRGSNGILCNEVWSRGSRSSSFWLMSFFNIHWQFRQTLSKELHWWMSILMTLWSS